MVRPAAVAGSFYPADPDVLRRWVTDALDRARARLSLPLEERPPKAIVVPHAGYMYSGDVAATAYAAVDASVDRVVLLGPAHRAPTTIAAPAVDAMITPLGDVRVDTARRDGLVDGGLVVVDDRVHADEHSLEVQLPFLQVALGDVAVLPLLVGVVPADEIVAVLDEVWDDNASLVVVSTDLSHYHDHATATELDRATAAAVVACRPEGLRPSDACGVYPLRGLLTAVAAHGLSVDLLDLRNSGDTAGPRDRVVGYGAFAAR